jgi:hypothetical protein
VAAEHLTNIALRERLAMPSPSTTAACSVPFCPKCHTQLNFRRSQQTADIDGAGFESYRFNCQECGAALVGIIDPADNALLLSECLLQPHNR